MINHIVTCLERCENPKSIHKGFRPNINGIARSTLSAFSLLIKNGCACHWGPIRLFVAASWPMEPLLGSKAGFVNDSPTSVKRTAVLKIDS
jgi:hypothetical protein